MPVPAMPGPDLVLIQAEFGLGFSECMLDPEALALESHETVEGGPARLVGQGVVDVAVLTRILDHEHGPAPWLRLASVPAEDPLHGRPDPEHSPAGVAHLDLAPSLGRKSCRPGFNRHRGHVSHQPAWQTAVRHHALRDVELRIHQENALILVNLDRTPPRTPR
jgi:hypothetical protein